MKKSKFNIVNHLMFSVIFLIMLLQSHCQSGGAPTVIYVSSSISSVVAPRGSIYGGTTVYIYGTNFSPDATQISINFGPYACNLIAGTSSTTMLACVTTAATISSQISNLALNITIEGQTPLICSSNNCLFNYLPAGTPIIHQIIPKTVKGNSLLNVFGYHRIVDAGDGRSFGVGQVKYLQIDSYTCSLIDVVQNNPINPDSRDNLQCRVYASQPTGQYYFTENVSPGTAIQSPRLLQTSTITGKNYTVRIAASIIQDFYHQGGMLGRKLQLAMNGEPIDITAYKCEISGYKCQVSSVEAINNLVSIEVPVYDPTNTAFGAINKEASDPTIQQSPFLGQYGFKYSRYAHDKWRNLQDWINLLRQNNNLTVLQSETTVTQLGSPQIYGENAYVEYMKGYLYIPQDGQYNFYAVVDDQLIVKISQYQNNSNPDNLVTKIFQNAYLSDHYNPFITKEGNNTFTQNFTAGYYYTEIVSINTGGPGYFKLAMSTPQNKWAYTANPTWQIDYFSIQQSDAKSEIINITVNGPQLGSNGFHIYYYVSNGDVLSLDSSSVIKRGDSAQTFLDKINNCNTLGSANPQVTLLTYDLSWRLTNITSQIVFYQYNITISQWRDASVYNLPNVQSNLIGSAVFVSKLQNHSPPIRGTYQIFVNDKSLSVNVNGKLNTNIPYNCESWALTQAINQFYNSQDIEVRQVMNTKFDDIIQFVIIYFGISNVYQIKVNAKNMTGGQSNNLNIIYNIQRFYDANRPLYDPIPYDFLRVASNSPSLLLQVNKIPIICEDCRYIYNSTLTASVTSSTLTGSSLRMSVTNTNNIPLALSDISISLLGQKCMIDPTGTLSNFVCLFATNSNGSPRIPAGHAKPIVHAGPIGYLDCSSISEITVTLSVTSLTPNQVGSQGNILAKIIGSGFPIGSSEGIVLSLCGNQISNFVSVQNTQINFIIPPQGPTCNNANSFIKINNITFSLTFAYNSTLTPLISSLSISSSSPIMKVPITIIGTNFPTINNLQVFLYDINQTQQYELTVTNMPNNSAINCILGGGKSGIYYVRVLNKNVGMSGASSTSKFEYRIFVQSISPSSGSLGGGYQIAITGQHFSSADSMTVFVGTAMNSLCKITSANSTTITCLMPPMDSSYSSGVPIDITVAGRATESSICSGTCGFTFDDTVTNYVTPLNSTDYKYGDIVTITGNDLTTATVKVDRTAVSIFNNTNTTLSFIYPALQEGVYTIYIMTSTGYTYPPLTTTTTKWINSTTSSTSGSYEGRLLSINGNGLSKDINDNNFIYFTCQSSPAITLKRISATPNLQTFQIPPMSGGQYCSINVTSGLIYKTVGFAYVIYQTSPANVTYANGQFSITLTNNSWNTFDKAWVVYTDLMNNPTNTSYDLTLTKINSTFYTASLATGTLPAGSFRFKLHSNNVGYAPITPSIFSINMTSIPTGLNLSVSYLGGAISTLSGNGFITNNPQNNYISVCGIKASVLSATSSLLTYTVPPLITYQSNQLYKLKINGPVSGMRIGDNPLSANYGMDENVNTYYTSSASTCYIGVDFGLNSAANIQKIGYFPNPMWSIVANYLFGAVFEGSNDNTTWTNIFTIDSSTHTGWNYWFSTTTNIQFRFIRLRHNATSQCQISELSFTGILYSTLSFDATKSKNCAVTVELPSLAPITATSTITYDPIKTSTVTSISPKFGPSIGGTVIHLSGTNFVHPNTLKIDGVECIIINETNTDVFCTTGMRAKPPKSGNSFEFLSGGNSVILGCEQYLYIDRWSQQSTWGGEALPRAGDSVYVPAGMTLLVDVPSTPELYTVIVQNGKIIFADEQDMTFDVHYFLVNGGQFRAGTPESPYQHKLTFTLYGSYFDKQLPTFGSKMIGCKNCQFNMHGIVRNPTWTDLNATIMPGTNVLSLNEPVDWLPGESIVVAASSFNHYESEQMVIATKSSDNKTLTTTKAFKFKHFSGIENYGGQQFIMRAEVGLLTRNIKMQGDPTSNASKYGSHLMMNGKVANGLKASISYAEFTMCGQPQIVGRYCTHFHMAGEVPESFVRGISVHMSYARVLTIHGTHYLLVEKNVGYHVEGHNIFIEDGIETHNIIQDNLMVTSISSFVMLQSDITVASYWITNPFNTFRRNHAAGGDFYGVWYELKDNPDGPSATFDMCPTGMRLGLSQDNVAHSNIRFGLRIFKLSARKYPCIPTKDQTLDDPYSGNPAYESIFENYTLWKNKECGFLGQELGFTTINNFRVIDSLKGGMQFHKTNFTKQFVKAKNSVIVGYSAGNGPILDLNSEYKDARGLIASRTDGLLIDSVQFINFGATMTPLQSCSECYDFRLWVTGGKTTHFKNITYQNIQGNYIFWEKWRREIFIDLDGTLLAPVVPTIKPTIPAQSKGSITPYRASLLIPNHCYNISGASWDDSIYCDETISLRGLLFTNANPSIDFASIDIKAKRLSDPYQNFTTQNLTDADFSDEYMIVIKKKSMDIPKSWAMPFASGYYYNIHWKWGIDFLHLNLAPSRFWSSTDAIVLRFNYSDVRQSYQIAKLFSQNLQIPYANNSATMIDINTCQNGDYYHDQNNSYLFVCVSGRNKAVLEWIDIVGTRCKYICPSDITTPTRQKFLRYWSDVSNWPNQILPKAGENVTIPEAWNLVLDCQTPIFKFVEVKGYLIFNADTDNLFQAHYIWVKGKITIGSSDKPYIHNATIVLHGQKDSSYLLVDSDASGNKMMVVTGGLEFYGQVTDNVWNRLLNIAPVNATSITVQSSSGWSVGDQIIIGASYAGRNETEKVTITNINGQVVSFTPALKYQHYGASSTTISNIYGTLDTRSGVGLLSRKIRITKGPDTNGWGCRVLIYSYVQNPDFSNPNAIPSVKNGYAILDGVEFDGCGQYDTTYAGLRIEKVGSLKPTIQNTTITRSSIHGCIGMCVYMDTSNNITFNNNVMYYARKFIVLVFTIDLYTFTNNFMCGAMMREEIAAALDVAETADDVCIYEQYLPFDPSKKSILVTNNLAQGSQGEGFVFPYTSCDYLDSYSFAGNTAGSCQIAYMLNAMDGQYCVGAKGLFGYASQIGLQANPPSTQQKLIYQNIFFADNQRGITLRFAHEIDDNSIFLRNSYITGVSRPNCSSCYSDQTIKYCKGGYAVRMFSATIGGERFPLAKKNLVFDVICNQQAFDFKSYFDNVLFENYYYNNPSLSYCNHMSVFKRHDLASDGVGSAYLTNTRCSNCEDKSWAYFDAPNPSWLGWFGGCGQLDCTGPNNYFIYDQDGLFTGSPSQIIANNSMICEHQPACTFIPEINGHHCKEVDYAVMEYESIAPDYNKRIMWPVYINYDGGKWRSVTNGWREWEWMGPEPLNLRLARFWSIVKLHKTYNVTFSSNPPSDMRYQLQKRLQPYGDPTDWLIIRVYYALPNTLEVLVKNTTGQDILVKPYPLINGAAENLTKHTSVCGANNFHYKNGTIQFVLNGINNCQVRVRLSSYVQISVTLSVPINTFFSNNGPTSFLTNICAFLGIDWGRLKIVEVNSRSTQVIAIIRDQAPAVINSTTPTNPAVTQTNLVNLQNSLVSGISLNSIDLGWPVLNLQTKTVVFNDDGSVYQQTTSTEKILIIILATTIPIIIIVCGIALFCYIRRRREKVFHESIDMKSSNYDQKSAKHPPIEKSSQSRYLNRIGSYQEYNDKFKFVVEQIE